jgi:hypothetical protein
MRNCCHLRLAIRWLKGDSPTERFTCEPRGCGQSYVWTESHWVPISGAEDILDMMAEEHERQRREKA